MISRRLLLVSVFAALASAGCSLTPENARVRRGKFSVSVRSASGQSSEQGRYELTELGGTTRLDLLSPLGGILARVTISEKGATLEQGDKELHASTGEELMERTLGFALPVSMLSCWISGTPDPQAPSRSLSADAFEQADWMISVRRRAPDGTPNLIGALNQAPGRSIRLQLTAESR
jgi:hypothetical protein